MKILVVNYEYPPIGGGGGSCCKEIVERLADRGNTVDIFTAGYKDFKKYEKINDNLSVYKIKSNRASEHEVGFFGLVSFVLRGMFKIRKFVKKGNYDVIHYHFSVPTGLLTFFHTKKVPIAITLHGIDVPNFHEDEFPLFQKVTKPFNKRIIKKANRVIAVSNNLKEKALETFKDKNIDVIYHGVDTKKFYKKNVKKKNDKVNFICVCRLVKFKRVDILIEAFKMFVDKANIDAHLTIVGTGYMEEELKELTAKLDLNQHVTFSGYVPNEKLVDVLNEADIFVLPSVHDSFGIVFVEAMACGLPCIGARSAGVPEVISENETGFLAKPEDAEDFYKCMEKLAKDKSILKKMGEKAHDLAHNKYNWEVMVDKYEELFKEMI